MIPYIDIPPLPVGGLFSLEPVWYLGRHRLLRRLYREPQTCNQRGPRSQSVSPPRLVGTDSSIYRGALGVDDFLLPGDGLDSSLIPLNHQYLAVLIWRIFRCRPWGLGFIGNDMANATDSPSGLRLMPLPWAGWPVGFSADWVVRSLMITPGSRRRFFSRSTIQTAPVTISDSTNGSIPLG